MMRRFVLLIAAVALAIELYAISDQPWRLGRPQPAPIEKVILVTIDALRADRLGCYGYTHAPTSPAIDAFASQSLLFERAYAQAPWTVPSMGSLMSGRYALDAGTYTNNGDILSNAATLPERFQRHGFNTAFFNSNPILWRPGIQRGFASVAPAPLGEKIPYTSIEPLVMAWLDRHAQEKFFLWIHDMDTHKPLTEGNSYLKNPAWDVYDAEVRWVDEAIGRLFAKLEALGIRQQVLFVFTADHGEAFGEHALSGHQDVIYDEVLRVPLIIQYPGMQQKGRTAEPVQLLDLNPTIGELAGLPASSGSGESMAPILRGEAAHMEHPYVFSSRYYFDRHRVDDKTGKVLFAPGQHHLAVHSSRWAMIAKVHAASADPRTRPDWDDDPQSAEYELYDLSVDPLEQHDLAKNEASATATLQHVLADWKHSGRRLARDPKPELDPATRESMYVLGYKQE